LRIVIDAFADLNTISTKEIYGFFIRFISFLVCRKCEHLQST